MKAYLLPDELCQQTKIHPTSEASVQSFNEVLSFEDTKSNNCLLISAYFIDTRQMRASLGHATLPLEYDDHDRMYRVHLMELANVSRMLRVLVLTRTYAKRSGLSDNGLLFIIFPFLSKLSKTKSDYKKNQPRDNVK